MNSTKASDGSSEGQVEGQSEKQIECHIEKQIERQIEKQTERQIEGPLESPIEGPLESPRSRQLAPLELEAPGEGSSGHAMDRWLRRLMASRGARSRNLRN